MKFIEFHSLLHCKHSNLTLIKDVPNKGETEDIATYKLID